jgi:predicted metal-dependent phosphoesterase TrpH
VARVLKAEFHTHSSADPCDYIPHTTAELIDRAVALGYQALALTLHDRWLDVRALAGEAKQRGLVVIDGVERTIGGCHVLLVNFGAASERVRTFDDLAALRRERPNGLVIAPHPFYPAGKSLRRQMDPNADLFDAVEYNAYYTAYSGWFNQQALDWARKHRKPVVANSDVHRLWQMGRTYSLVEAEPNADAICAAVRAGAVEIRSAPLTTLEATTHIVNLVLADLFRRPIGDAASASPEAPVTVGPPDRGLS